MQTLKVGHPLSSTDVFFTAAEHDIADFILPVLPDTLAFGSSEQNLKVTFESLKSFIGQPNVVSSVFVQRV